MTYLWLLPALLVAGFLAYRGARCWADAARRGFPPWERLRWALWGAVVPARYWWEARIEAMPQQERSALLARETAALGLKQADGLRCPLCGTEVPGAWTLDAQGQAAVAPGPVECPACDFRLDACRHCAHFLPGAPRSLGVPSWQAGDITSGRCGHYKAWQAVERTTTPDMAKQLKARGWDRVRGPLPIADSFLPPDHCSAFKPDRKRLKAGEVQWPDARRVALLRILAPPQEERAPDPDFAPDDELWLM
jgi:hypothetical protein